MSAEQRAMNKERLAAIDERCAIIDEHRKWIMNQGRLAMSDARRIPPQPFSADLLRRSLQVPTGQSRTGPGLPGLPDGRVLIRRLISGHSKSGLEPPGLPDIRVCGRRRILGRSRAGPGMIGLPHVVRCLCCLDLTNPRQDLLTSPCRVHFAFQVNQDFMQLCSLLLA